MFSISKRRNDKAITLIALVITIVVLIILAVVTISIAIGENGIFSRAQRAGQEYLNAQIYEETEISKSNYGSDGYINESRGYAENIKQLLDIDGLDISLQDILTSESFMDKVISSEDTLSYVLSNNECINIILNSKIALKKVLETNLGKTSILNNESNYNYLTSVNQNNESFLDDISIGVPLLTSNNSSSPGIAFASSELSARYAAYKAFDNNNEAEHQWATSSLTNQYVGYMFENNIRLYKVKLTAVVNNNDVQNTKNWYIQYSDDGTTYTTASSTASRESDHEPLSQVLLVNYNAGAHKYWRVFCPESLGTKYLGIGELKYYGI